MSKDDYNIGGMKALLIVCPGYTGLPWATWEGFHGFHNVWGVGHGIPYTIDLFSGSAWL